MALCTGGLWRWNFGTGSGADPKPQSASVDVREVAMRPHSLTWQTPSVQLRSRFEVPACESFAKPSFPSNHLSTKHRYPQPLHHVHKQFQTPVSA